MRVLGIDPGYDRLGIAILEQGNQKETLVYSTCIETDRQEDLPERLYKLGVELKKIIKKYNPDCLGIEKIFFNKNQKTAVAVAEARGMIIFLAKEFNCKIYEFGPQEIKVAITGYGKSDKQAVFDMLKRLINNLPKKALDDEYDAIAVGITTLAHHN